LVDRLSEGPPTLVGIDHGFSFPIQYFEQHGLPPDWAFFLDDAEFLDRTAVLAGGRADAIDARVW
jgi:hypothetical protein